MPEKRTLKRAAEDKKQGKAPSTQAGEFVREEMDHVREGKHGVSSPKQAIAIGLSKAREAGVDIPPPPGKAKKKRAAVKKTARAKKPSVSKKNAAKSKSVSAKTKRA